MMLVTTFVMAGSVLTLAYRPFLDPLPVDVYWLWFAVPLVFAIALVYKAIRMPDIHVPGKLVPLFLDSAKLAAQVLAFMVLAAVGVYVVLGRF